MTTQDVIAPSQSECEARLTRLWETNLGVSVSSSDDYFERGGDSLRGTELLTWIYDGFGVELSLLDLFETRTIATQTELLLSRLRADGRNGTRPQTEYRYIGPGDKRLFGAFHHAQSETDEPPVLLCYPIGQEYMRIHRTYVELARKLASSGHTVLRFDYYGCGDSAGETTDGSLEQWTQDILEAIEELREETGRRKVHLVGARAGANLALRAANRTNGIASLVLWEPITNGSNYLELLRKAHRDLLRSNAELDGYEKHASSDWVEELVGYPITRKLQEELLALDLSADSASNKVSNVLVLVNSDKPALAAYANARHNGAGHFDYLAAGESDAIWLREDRQNKGVVPAKAVQAIDSWLAGRVQ